MKAVVGIVAVRVGVKENVFDGVLVFEGVEVRVLVRVGDGVRVLVGVDAAWTVVCTGNTASSTRPIIRVRKMRFECRFFSGCRVISEIWGTLPKDETMVSRVNSKSNLSPQPLSI
jgi:hypothetical protein